MSSLNIFVSHSGSFELVRAFGAFRDEEIRENLVPLDILLRMVNCFAFRGLKARLFRMELDSIEWEVLCFYSRNIIVTVFIFRSCNQMVFLSKCAVFWFELLRINSVVVMIPGNTFLSKLVSFLAKILEKARIFRSYLEIELVTNVHSRLFDYELFAILFLAFVKAQVLETQAGGPNWVVASFVLFPSFKQNIFAENSEFVIYLAASGIEDAVHACELVPRHLCGVTDHKRYNSST